MTSNGFVYGIRWVITLIRIFSVIGLKSTISFNKVNHKTLFINSLFEIKVIYFYSIKIHIPPIKGGMQLLLFTFLNFKDCQKQKADTRLRRESAERPNITAAALIAGVHIAIGRKHVPSIVSVIFRTRPIEVATTQLNCNTTTI